MEILELEGFVDVTALCRPAIYALVRRGEVVYIGRSEQPIVRVYTHWKGYVRYNTKGPKRIKGMVFDALWLMPCNPFRLEDVEREMIRKYLPRYNTKDKPKPTPNDLARIMQVLLPVVTPQPNTEPRIRRRI